jgi:hypothetical protein
VIAFAMGKRAAALLEQLRSWMAHDNAVIIALLCLIIGVKLIGDAISGLSGLSARHYLTRHRPRAAAMSCSTSWTTCSRSRGGHTRPPS